MSFATFIQNNYYKQNTKLRKKNRQCKNLTLLKAQLQENKNNGFGADKSISSNVQPMITNRSCKLTQIILNLSPALNAHKNLNGILQYISNQRYHCYIALQSKKFEPIDVLTKH